MTSAGFTTLSLTAAAVEREDASHTPLLRDAAAEEDSY